MAGILLSRAVVFGLLLVVGLGCAAKPIAEQYRKEAKAEDLTFPMVLQNPDAYVGDIVLWGGDIVQTTNINEGTEIIVLETPLGGGERPEKVKESQGRFIAMSSKFLDPSIYKAGRKITLAGQVAGKKTRPLGETTYTYPVVTIKQLHLWKKRPPYVYYPYDYWGPGWGWGPYWGWGPGFYGGVGEEEEEHEGHEGHEGGERGGDRK